MQCRAWWFADKCSADHVGKFGVPDASSEPDCPRDQEHPRTDGDGAEGSRGTSPAAARRSTEVAAVTTYITRRSITPMTRRIAVWPAQQ
jgi:hypothetical protein